MEIRDDLREKCKNSLNLLLKDNDISKTIEDSIFKESNLKSKNNNIYSNYDLYIEITRRLLINLDKKSHVKNNYFFKTIKNKKIDIENIASLEFQKLFPKLWENTDLDIENSSNQKSKNKKRGMFTCFKCKSKDCITSQVQTRSADEGLTLFVTCLNCNNKWKMN